MLLYDYEVAKLIKDTQPDCFNQEQSHNFLRKYIKPFLNENPSTFLV
jgi:hypothetical protein